MQSGISWEGSKENIQPLKAGRKPDALKKALGDSTGTIRLNELEQEKLKIETEIASYSGPDPLEPYLKYIKWTQESYPAGTRSLTELLHKTATTFKDKAQYKNDRRYLQVWILLCDSVKEPLDIFHFLEHNCIGIDDYMLYDAWGRHLEAIKDYQSADKVYQKGVDHRAQPEDKMKQCQVQYQARMYQVLMEKARRKAAGEDDEDEQPDIENRNALGSLKGVTSVRTYDAAPAGLGGRDASKKRIPASSSRSNSSLDIYVDDEFASQDDKKRRKPTVTGPSVAPQKPGWTNLPSEAERSKENSDIPSAWNNARIPQDHSAKAAAARSSRTTASAPKAAGFSVFVDDQFENATADSKPAPQPASLRLRLDGEKAKESNRLIQLQQNPLKVNPYRFKIETEVYEKAVNDIRRLETGGYEKSAYDRESVYPGDGKEYSFEEIRAKRIFERQVAEQAALGAQQEEEENMMVDEPGSPVPAESASLPSLQFNVASPFENRSISAIESNPSFASLASPAPAPAPVSTAPVSAPAPFTIFEDENAALATAPVKAPAVVNNDENQGPAACPAPTSKPRAPFRERTLTIKPETLTQTASTHVSASFDEPEPTMTTMMTIHTREALGAFIGAFNSASRDETPEPTSTMVTSLIEPKMVSGGFTIFEDSEPLEEAPHPKKKPAPLFEIFEDQENFPPKSQAATPPNMRRSGSALAPISDGSIPYDPSAERSQQEEDDDDDEIMRPQQRSAVPSGDFSVFEDHVATGNPLDATFENIIQNSPASFGAPRPVSNMNASFAVTPFGSTTHVSLASDLEQDICSPGPQRALNFNGTRQDAALLEFSPQTLQNTMANATATHLASPISPISRRPVNNAGEATGTFHFTLGPGDITNSFFDADRSFGMTTQALKTLQLDDTTQNMTGTSTKKSSKKDDRRRVNALHLPVTGSVIQVAAVADAFYNAFAQSRMLDEDNNVFECFEEATPTIPTTPSAQGVLRGAPFRVLRTIDDARADAKTLIIADPSNPAPRLLRLASSVVGWEYYVSQRLLANLPENTRGLIVNFNTQYFFNNGTVSLLDVSQHLCTLQDIIDARIHNENLAVYFMVQLLALVETMHDSGFFFGGVSPKSFLVKNADIENVNNFKPGMPEWNFRAPQLVDFSSAIDTNCFAQGSTFAVDAILPQHLRALAKGLAGVAFESDAFAVCDIAHQMLYGKPLEYDSNGTKFVCKSKPKVFWKVQLWNSFFDSLLNCDASNVTSSVSSLRKQFEEYLLSVSSKLPQLKTQLQDLKCMF